jgi:CubicO group peptidase (beta-lactamase class C family)
MRASDVRSATNIQKASAKERLLALAVWALMTCPLAACTTASPGVTPRFGSQYDVQTESRIERIFAGVTDPVLVRGEPVRSTSIAARMAEHHVPALSVAVVDGGRLAWARALGIADASSGRAVTPHTVFQAASISKAIAATLTLRLVQQGRLDLDVDVNRYLSSWQVPNNEFTREQKVTLRRLMAHRAGTTVHGFLSIPQGQRLPTTVQILEGAGPPGYQEPVRVDAVPGTATRYSGGGVLIEQLVATDVMHESYVDLARRLVFEPLGMFDSSFEQVLSPAQRAAAASAHDGAGQVYAGNFLMLAAQAPGGLWTTPADLVRWAIEVARAETGGAPHLLSAALASTMTHRLAASEPVALGTFVWGEGRGRYYWHGGHNEGYLSELIYFPESGQGAAVMTNADGGGNLLRSVLNAIATEYGWVQYGPLVIDRAATDSKIVARLVGTYQATAPTTIDLAITPCGLDVCVESKKFGIRSIGVLTAPGEITLTSQAMTEIIFVAGPDGEITDLRLGAIRFARQPAASSLDYR